MSGRYDDPSVTDERSVHVSLVVPFFNPGPVVRQTVERAAHALEATGRTFEMIAVSDGSTDGSETSLCGVLPGLLEVVTLTSNRGKGYALRTGMERARGALIAFIDADGDIPPELLTEFVRVASDGGGDIVYGSKRDPASTVEAPMLRRVFSRSYGGLVRLLFGLSVLDTQTGIKVVRRQVLSAVLPTMIEDRYAIDLELFVLAFDRGHRAFVALPVRIDKAYTTTVSFRAAWTVLVDSLKIYWRLRLWPAITRTKRSESGSGENGHPPAGARPARSEVAR